jgi:serine/threonine-protein kinase
MTEPVSARTIEYTARLQSGLCNHRGLDQALPEANGLDPRNFFAELKRRHVYKVAVAYAVVAWLLIQIATQTFPFFEIPNWAARLVIVFLILGFPIALILAWAFELTPKGLKRTEWTDAASGQATATPAARPQAAKRPGAIAVLPLENLAGQQGEEYFADGMTEALITDLAKIGGLKVISRGSVMGFKDTKQPLAEIARALGVEFIVEGSVLREQDRIRISTRLVRAETDEYLWAERYDRELAHVLTLQDDVARAIAHAIDQTLHGRAGTAPRRVDPEVYVLDLRGRHYWHQRTETGFRSALQLFEDAVTRDPTYAPAYVGIAESLNMLANYGIVPPPQIRPRSLAAAQRALELDEHSSDAHRVLAFVHWQFEFAWEAAIAEYERALELDPHSPSTTYWFGVYLAVIGFFDRSHQLLDRAQELDPLSLVVPSVQGWTRFFARRFEQALPYYEQVLMIDPHFHLALWFRGEALVELERYDEGIASLERAYELGGQTSRLLGYLGYAYGRAGREDRARGSLAELDARQRCDYVPPYFPALVLSGLGQYDGALDRLEQAYRERDTMLRDLKADAHWHRMRSLPRFQTLMQQMAFPDMSKTAG